MGKIGSKVLTAFGLIFILISCFLLYQQKTPNPIGISQIIAKDVEVVPSTPTLVIRDLGISTSIYPAKEVKRIWKTDSRGVSRHENIIYGHNWNSILGNLTKAKVGMEVETINSDGVASKYKIELIQEINPSEINITENVTDKKLVIYTCSGFLDTKRFVVVATQI